MQNTYKKIGVVLVLVLSIFLVHNTAFADSQVLSPNTTYSIVPENLNGQPEWLNSDNSKISDDSYTTSAWDLVGDNPSNRATRELRANNFGFSIPADAHIDGIVVEIKKRASADSLDHVTDDLVKLHMAIDADSFGSENKADTATFWSTTDSTSVYGDTFDLWSDFWTQDDINSPNFGVGVMAHIFADSSAITAFIDHIQITVFYSMPILTTINLAPTTAEILLPNTKQLVAETLDQFSNPIPASLTWISDDETVATVDSNGLVTGVSIGSVNITANNGTVTSEATLIKVSEPIKKKHGGGGGGRVAILPLPVIPTETLAPLVISTEPEGEVLGVSIFIFTQNLKWSSRGNDVTELQKKLTVEKVYSGPISGFFGPLTFAGVKKFQTKYGLVADGIVGPKTRGKLNSLY